MKNNTVRKKPVYKVAESPSKINVQIITFYL